MGKGIRKGGTSMTPARWSFCITALGWHRDQRPDVLVLPMLARLGLHAENEPTQSVFQEAPHARPLESFEGFVRQHERALLNYLWRLLGDEQSAYDLTQEAFVRAWQQFEKISRYEQPRAWLFRVATNLALNQRQHQAHPVGAAAPLDEQQNLASSDHAGRLVESDLVRQILQRLPPKQRAALVLREVYGFSAEEVGKILGMRLGAVKMTLSRARAQFRQLYLEEDQQP
jgi:RNA polymerase sigma-70 factor (ECF subfamily)